MKIVLLYDKLNVGGTEKLVVLIANLLVQHNHSVNVVLTQTQDKLDHLLNPNIKVEYLNRVNKFSIKPLQQLARSCKGADVVHVHAYFNYRYYFLAKTLFGTGKAKVVLHEHSSMSHTTWFDKFLFKKLNAFIAVSQKQLALVSSWNVLPSSKLFLISNIISVVNKLQPKSQPTYKVLMVGNIRREKNYLLALEIIRHFADKLQLTIYGNINDQVYYEELKSGLQKNGLDSSVTIISGEAEVSTYYNQFDLALHTATDETGPLVLMEYLSAGLPFFTSIAGQTPTVIAEQLPDVLISSFDKRDWIKNIENFYGQTQEKRNAISEEMKRKSDAIINEEKYYQQLLTVYQAALSN